MRRARRLYSWSTAKKTMCGKTFGVDVLHVVRSKKLAEIFTLGNCGVRVARGNTCMFGHQEHDTVETVHGDEFVSTADIEDLRWLEKLAQEEVRNHDRHHRTRWRKQEANHWQLIRGWCTSTCSRTSKECWQPTAMQTGQAKRRTGGAPVAGFSCTGAARSRAGARHNRSLRFVRVRPSFLLW